MYGVLLGRKHFPKVRQVIEKAYPGLTPRAVDNSTLVTLEVVEKIYQMFVRYIKEVGIEVGTNSFLSFDAHSNNYHLHCFCIPYIH